MSDDRDDRARLLARRERDGISRSAGFAPPMSDALRRFGEAADEAAAKWRAVARPRVFDETASGPWDVWRKQGDIWRELVNRSGVKGAIAELQREVDRLSRALKGEG